MILWERALEFRGPGGRRLLPRATVHAVSLATCGGTEAMVLATAQADLQLVGAHVGPLAHRIGAWLGAPGASPYAEGERVLGGGRASLEADGQVQAAMVTASPTVVRVFLDGGGAPRWTLPWDAVAAGPVLPLAGGRLHGAGVDAVRALALLARPDGGIPQRQVTFGVAVEVGWMRLSHVLVVGTAGLGLVPCGRWAALWSGSRRVPWSEVRSVEREGPHGLRMRVDGGDVLVELAEAAGVLAELRRQRLAHARSEDHRALAAGRAAAGWVVQHRIDDRQGWRWGRLVRDGADLVVCAQGAMRPIHRLRAADVRWWPQVDHPLTLVVEGPEARTQLRPVCGQRFLVDWTRWLGAPARGPEGGAEVDGPRPLAATGTRRRDTRIRQSLQAWLDPHGRVPDVDRPAPTHTLEIAMSSVVVRWPTTLPVGREVGLALDLGGLPLATRARVVRQVGPQMWALQFRSPPAALVHRIGSRVRAHERAELTASRTGGVPLSVGG